MVSLWPPGRVYVPALRVSLPVGAPSGDAMGQGSGCRAAGCDVQVAIGMVPPPTDIGLYLGQESLDLRRTPSLHSGKGG